MYTCFVFAFTRKFATFLVESDYNIIDRPIVIQIGESEVCFQLLAVDDEIIESEEDLILIVEPTNPNDRVVGNTTVTIVDNDCKGYNNVAT